MPKTRQELFTTLDDLGIAATTVTHPPLFTVAQSQELRGGIEGEHTKNLFLKDKKGRYFLVTIEENSEVDLKTIHQRIGATGRVTFGKPEALLEMLGVEPGSVTPFGLINDMELRVTFVLDAALADAAIVNCHPLANDATTAISGSDLLKFADASGHPPMLLNMAPGMPHLTRTSVRKEF